MSKRSEWREVSASRLIVRSGAENTEISLTTEGDNTILTSQIGSQSISIQELVKLTPKDHEERLSLEAALESMLVGALMAIGHFDLSQLNRPFQDLSLYINEVKRDVETLAAIRSIQASITDLSMVSFHIVRTTMISMYFRLIFSQKIPSCVTMDDCLKTVN